MKAHLFSRLWALVTRYRITLWEGGLRHAFRGSALPIPCAA
jgi:hypothetical protein